MFSDASLYTKTDCYKTTESYNNITQKTRTFIYTFLPAHQCLLKPAIIESIIGKNLGLDNHINRRFSITPQYFNLLRQGFYILCRIYNHFPRLYPFRDTSTIRADNGLTNGKRMQNYVMKIFMSDWRDNGKTRPRQYSVKALPPPGTDELNIFQTRLFGKIFQMISLRHIIHQNGYCFLHKPHCRFIKKSMPRMVGCAATDAQDKYRPGLITVISSCATIPK